MCLCGGVVEAGLAAAVAAFFVRLWRKVRRKERTIILTDSEVPKSGYVWELVPPPPGCTSSIDDSESHTN